MKCLLCDESIDAHIWNESCSFHSGQYHHFIERSNDAAWYSVMQQRPLSGEEEASQIDGSFEWGCCGRRAVRASGEEGPRRSVNGCRQSPIHRLSVKAHCLTDKNHRMFAEEQCRNLTGAGVEITISTLDTFDGSVPSGTDCLIVICGEDGISRAIDWTEHFRCERPALPMVIFSDPDRVDGWRLQASSSWGLTGEDVREAVAGVLRSGVPNAMPAPRVFLSYSRPEAKKMRWVHDYFRRNEEACWNDTDFLGHGVDWSSEIDAAIEAAAKFVLIVSGATTADTYCWRELRLARAARLPVFVLAYDGAEEIFLSSEDAVGREWRRTEAMELFQGTSHPVIEEVSAEGRYTIVFPVEDRAHMHGLKTVVDYIASLEGWRLMLKPDLQRIMPHKPPDTPTIWQRVRRLFL